ncbi:MAG: TetR/AcrR family transcriptional regulator [Stackebrandtia sp.]
MRAKPEKSGLTVTEQARRNQITAAAIETIAALGYSRASFSQIARRAGLSSTGLISYHFAGKDDLMDAVLHRILGDFTDFVMARPDDGTAAGALRTFLEANLDFMREHRDHMVTLLRVRSGYLEGEERVASGAKLFASDRLKMADLLREGQRAGEFRDFDADFMAGFILSLRNGVISRLGTEADFDLDTCARELLAAVELATRKGHT